MSNCDCQENIEDDKATVTATTDKEPITLGATVTATADIQPITFEDGLLITTVTSATAVLFFGLRN